MVSNCEFDLTCNYKFSLGISSSYWGNKFVTANRRQAIVGLPRLLLAPDPVLLHIFVAGVFHSKPQFASEVHVRISNS